MIFGKTRRNFLERKKKETKETKKTKKTKKKKKKKKQQQQRLFLFVRLSVCVSTTVISSYFVFRLLDPPSFFFSSRKKNCIDLSNQNRNDEREREKKKCFPLLFTYRFFLSHRFCRRDLHRRSSVVSFLVASSARFCKRRTKSSDDDNFR